MARLAPIRPKDLIRALKKIGFHKHNQVGSHATFKHNDGRRVTVPTHNRESEERSSPWNLERYWLNDRGT